MQAHDIKKTPGKSWLIDTTGKYHEFYANDQYHPQVKEVNKVVSLFSGFSHSLLYLDLRKVGRALTVN